ncbi:MAG: mechanosensitive ion channel [Saprospiraceae bacterium]
MDFTQISEFFSGYFAENGDFIFKIIGAILVYFLGKIIASMIKKLVVKVMKRTTLDNKLFKNSAGGASPEAFVGKLVYYLIMIIVLMIVLEILGFTQVLDPLKDMLGQFLGFIPNIVVASIIGFAGYMIATIVSDLVGMASSSLGKYSTKLGLKSEINLPKLIKQLVFIVVFIPVLIAALDALKIAAVSEPLKEMLSTFINAIPNVIAAAVIVTVFYVGGKFLSTMGAELLKNLGTDNLANKLNLQSVVGTSSLSSIIANLGFAFLMVTGIITALDKLNFTKLSEIFSSLLELSGQIFFGLIIMAIGNYVSNIAYDTFAKNKDNAFMASMARIATLGLFLAIALRTMGIANDIVNLAFGLTLGAIAVAIALAFGLGGRKAAGKQMEYFFSNLRGENKSD